MAKKKTKQNVIVWVVIIIAILIILQYFNIINPFALSLFGVNPLSTINVFEAAEPTTTLGCNQLDGICIPINQRMTDKRLEYGSCSNSERCEVKDLCMETGGVIEHRFNSEFNTFIRSCACTIDSKYDMQKGCVKKYG